MKQINNTKLHKYCHALHTETDDVNSPQLVPRRFA